MYADFGVQPESTAAGPSATASSATSSVRGFHQTNLSGGAEDGGPPPKDEASTPGGLPPNVDSNSNEGDNLSKNRSSQDDRPDALPKLLAPAAAEPHPLHPATAVYHTEPSLTPPPDEERADFHPQLSGALIYPDPQQPKIGPGGMPLPGRQVVSSKNGSSSSSCAPPHNSHGSSPSAGERGLMVINEHDGDESREGDELSRDGELQPSPEGDELSRELPRDAGGVFDDEQGGKSGPGSGLVPTGRQSESTTVEGEHRAVDEENVWGGASGRGSRAVVVGTTPPSFDERGESPPGAAVDGDDGAPEGSCDHAINPPSVEKVGKSDSDSRKNVSSEEQQEKADGDFRKRSPD